MKTLFVLLSILLTTATTSAFADENASGTTTVTYRTAKNPKGVEVGDYSEMLVEGDAAKLMYERVKFDSEETIGGTTGRHTKSGINCSELSKTEYACMVYLGAAAQDK